MVEDLDKNIQFLIHYGTDEVTHCVGCSGRDLHIFDTLTAKKIASEIERVARSHNATTKYSDYRWENANVEASNIVVRNWTYQ